MPAEYRALALERAGTNCWPHSQVEEFGYDFREWVTPYTKGAHKRGGIALVLQDWASKEALAQGYDPVLQLHGRAPKLRTNVRLEELLQRVLGISLQDVYATNAFPFIKAGAMDAPLRLREVEETVRRFTAKELELANPTVVLALGVIPYSALQRVGLCCVGLPHPAARIGGIVGHERAWRLALSAEGIPMRRPTSSYCAT